MDFIDGENIPTMPMPEPTAQAEASQASGEAKPGETQAMAQNPEQTSELEESKSGVVKPSSVVRNFNVHNLETFQKYKILGAPAQS